MDHSIIASNPQELFEFYQDRLVILDEVHMVPELFSILRAVIDEGRWVGNRTARFLLLGSASLDVVDRSSQSLAGKIECVELNPLNLLEVLNTGVLQHGNEKTTSHSKSSKLVSKGKIVKDLWFRGGLPDSYLSRNDIDSMVFRANFIRTTLERDIPSFGFRVPAPLMRSFWKLLAHNQGKLLNAANLAVSLSISSNSVKRYIELLESLLLVRRLHPYHENIKKKLVKSPKVYIRDSGLLHALHELSNFHDLLKHHIVGASWEGFVIENLLSVSPWGTTASLNSQQ